MSVVHESTYNERPVSLMWLIASTKPFEIWVNHQQPSTMDAFKLGDCKSRLLYKLVKISNKLSNAIKKLNIQARIDYLVMVFSLRIKTTVSTTMCSAWLRFILHQMALSLQTYKTTCWLDGWCWFIWIWKGLFPRHPSWNHICVNTESNSGNWKIIRRDIWESPLIIFGT